jgi:sec-independent protein translocase protein TatB
MFDIGWGEFLVIGIVALIAIGPKELPAVLRTVGQWMTKLRRMASEFQGQFQEAIREAEMADLKKEVDAMTDQAKSYTNFDPIGDIRREIETIADKPAETPSAAAAETSATPPVEAAAPVAPEPPTTMETIEPPAQAAPEPAPAVEPAPAPAPQSQPNDWPEPATFRDIKTGAGGKPA